MESVTQSHYAEFLNFSQRFADWAQLVNVQLTQVLDALPKLQEKLVDIKSDTEQILAIVQQLMARADLSPQIKPRDELTQYNPANLELIKKARQLLQRLPSSDPQYSRAAIGLGSVVSSQGDLTQAEALFTKAYQQANNDMELDKGEKQTLNMAIYKNADYVIIDEKIARNIAEYLGLSVTGTLGI